MENPNAPLTRPALSAAERPRFCDEDIDSVRFQCEEPLATLPRALVIGVLPVGNFQCDGLPTSTTQQKQEAEADKRNARGLGNEQRVGTQTSKISWTLRSRVH